MAQRFHSFSLFALHFFSPITYIPRTGPTAAILLNCHPIPADKPNRNGLQAQNAQPFLLKTQKLKDPDGPDK
jgi:hypothetical protein